MVSKCERRDEAEFCLDTKKNPIEELVFRIFAPNRLFGDQRALKV